MLSRVGVGNGTIDTQLEYDAVAIFPHPVAGGVIQALERLGFRLRDAEIEEAHPEMNSHYPFIQE